MEAAAHLMAHPEVPHGPIRVCFTCDEEIGHGVDHVDLKKLGAVVGYTLDGSGQGEIDGETFSADLAVVTITRRQHSSVDRQGPDGQRRAAGRACSSIGCRSSVLSPETTDGRDGFLHPYRIEGGVAEVTIRILLRDFDTAQAGREGGAAARRRPDWWRPSIRRRSIDVKVTPQYRNMADGLAKEPRAVPFAEEAMRRAGLRAEADHRARRHRRLAPDRTGPADAEPLDRRAQSCIRRWNGPAWKRWRRRCACWWSWRRFGGRRERGILIDGY